MHEQLAKKTVNSILGMIGGDALNMTLDNVSYICTKNIPVEEQMANILSGKQGGGKKKISTKKIIKKE